MVFGTSLSDSGNVFVLQSDPAAFGLPDDCELDTLINTPPDDSSDSYRVSGGNHTNGARHISNGPTWIEQFARGRGMFDNARPALNYAEINSNNYAVAGARARDFDCRFNLQDQLNTYQSEFPVTSAKTLVVIEMGSNDVRDALAGLAQSEDPEIIIERALANIGNAIRTLYNQGGREFLIANVPPIGVTPAIKILEQSFPGTINAANELTATFNAGLLDVILNLRLFLPDINLLRILDTHAWVTEIIENPASFGITNTEDACVTSDVPPFKCKKPDAYLFWDTLHPTTVVHGILAQKAIEVLFTIMPSSLSLYAEK